METLGPSPYLWIEFDKSGALRDPDVLNRLAKALSDSAATDLVVISHGWKNDRDAAMRIYKPLWVNTCEALDLDAAHIVVGGVLWPSVPHRDNFDEAALLESSGGGGLSSGDGLPVSDIDDATLATAIDDFLGDDADGAFRDLAEAAAQDFSGNDAVHLVRQAIARIAVSPGDPELSGDISALEALSENDPRGVLQSLAAKPAMPVEPSVGGGLGVGDSIQKVFEGGKAAVARLLGQLTFFDMKQRAGIVGASLGRHLAKEAPAGVRLHLVGHSFGARLVTSASAEIAKQGRRVDTLTLLQGAFSHNALSPAFEGKPGAFAGAVGGVDLIAITHTHNDKACTLAYAAASRVSRDVASSVGDANDRFGAMGANGAQHVQAVMHTALPGEAATAPVPGKINNYLADAYIRGNPEGHDAHGDVFNPRVGQLLASVIQTAAAS